ncbi:fibronectin type III domain-containing protein, partial [Streptomyces sp. NPDC055607]
MVKKIAVFSTLLFTLLVSSLATGANAATVDWYGAIDTHPDGRLINTSAQWYDNDENTFAPITTYGGWIFKPTDVEEVRIKSDVPARVRIFSPDQSTVIDDFVTQGTGKMEVYTVNYKDVRQLRVTLPTGGTPGNLYEVDLITPLLSNPEPQVFVINNLTYTKTSDQSGTLKWDQLSSTRYLKEYRIYHNNNLIAQTKNTSYSVSGLKLGETHEFKVTAVDGWGVEYNPARVDYVAPPPDTTPPGQPTGLRVSPDRYTAYLTWTGPTDPDLDGYYVYLDGRLVSTIVKVEQFNLGNLKMDTDYEVYVQAVDKAGNKSIDSNVVKFKTLGLTTVPSAVYGLTATPYSGSVSLTFSASPGATHYEIYMNGTKLLETKNTFMNV